VAVDSQQQHATNSLLLAHQQSCMCVYACVRVFACACACACACVICHSASAPAGLLGKEGGGAEGKRGFRLFKVTQEEDAVRGSLTFGASTETSWSYMPLFVWPCVLPGSRGSVRFAGVGVQMRGGIGGVRGGGSGGRGVGARGARGGAVPRAYVLGPVKRALSRFL